MPITPDRVAPDLGPAAIIQIRVTGLLLRRIEDWRRRKLRIPSRAVAGRILIEHALDAEDRASAKPESGRAAS
jgi:hypothetical protein